MTGATVGPRFLTTLFNRPRPLPGGLGPVQQRAEAVWEAEAYNPAVKEWLVDSKGNGHHMRLGSVGRAAVLDGALVLNGVSGQYATSPDHADLDITGDIDLRAKAAPVDWTPATEQVFIAKSKASTNQRSYLLVLNVAGGLLLYWSNNGTAVLSASSTIAVPAADGDTKWVRATLDVDNGSAENVVTFYTSDDGVTWTPLGSPVVTAGTTSIHASAEPLEIGSNDGGTARLFSGKVYRAIIKNGIDGTTVFDTDFSPLSDGTPWFLDSTGKRVTVMPTRAAVVDGALWLPGGAVQYAQTPDHNDLDITSEIDIRVKVAMDDWTPGATQVLLSKRATNQNSFQVHIAATTGIPQVIVWSDGSATSATASATVAPVVADGASKWLRVTWRDSDNRVQFFTSDDGTAWTQLGADATAAVAGMWSGTAPVSIGYDNGGSGTNTLSGKVYRAIIKNGIDGTTVFDVDFSTWDDGDGMGGYPKRESTNKAVLVLSDTTGADSNDPKWLAYDSNPGSLSPSKRKGLYLPGVAGNYASVPDEAALDIVGDITIDAEVALDDWTPASFSVLVAKRTTGQEAYMLRLGTTGLLDLTWWVATIAVTRTATVAVPAVDGQRLWVRATLDVNNGAVGHDVKFFTSTDGVTWTQLGATVTTAGVTGIDPTTAPVEIGSQVGGTGALSNGRFFHSRIYNAYTSDGSNPAGGNLVLDIDFADTTVVEPYATFVCDSGQTVTINRSATGRKSAVVDRPMFLFGTDDYMECADHAALDFAAAESFTTAIGLRRYGVPAGTQVYLAKKVNITIPDPGFLTLQAGAASNVTARVGDAAAETDALTGNVTSGAAQLVAHRRDVGADEVRAFLDGVGGAAVTDTTTGTLVNASPLALGRLSSAGTRYADLELVGAGIWREALSAADVTALDAEFGTNV